MKIALISNMYPTKEFPVYGVFVKNTELLLNKFGIETIQKAVIKGRKNGIKKIFSYLLLFFKIVGIFLNSKTEIVYIHFPLQTSIIINFLRLFSNKKIVLNIHGSELNNASFFSNSFKKLLLNSDLIVVPSNFYKEKIKNSYKIDDNKIYVYPSGGIDRSIFKKIETKTLRENLNIKETDFVCTYISTITREKGWREIIELAVLLEHKKLNIKYLVIGNGDEEFKMKNKVKSYGLEKVFIFLDRQNQKSLNKYYSMSDVFIFPTHRESLGLVGIESLSCGTPVIASNIDATKEYIRNGINGYLFEKGDEKDLTKKVFSFYSLNDRKSFGTEAIKTAIEYDSTVCTKLFVNKLKELCH